jgi:ABC-type glycerol-3-phosphate transport system permease component
MSTATIFITLYVISFIVTFIILFKQLGQIFQEKRQEWIEKHSLDEKAQDILFNDKYHLVFLIKFILVLFVSFFATIFMPVIYLLIGILKLKNFLSR